MDLNQYQHKSRETALYPNLGKNPIYPTLGLAGEAGEVADKVKKVLRDKNGFFTLKNIQESEIKLLFSHIGYELKKLILSSLLMRNLILK